MKFEINVLDEAETMYLVGSEIKLSSMQLNHTI